jgi:hypothetical protein
MKTVGTQFDISAYAGQLAAACTDVCSVWLIGSRANDTERPDSDWDLLVFGGPGAHACLSSAHHLHRADIDCLVLSDSEDFSNAWGPRSKSGSLSGWEWTQVSSNLAQYTEAKPRGEGDNFNVVLTRRDAKLVWRRGEHAI